MESHRLIPPLEVRQADADSAAGFSASPVDKRRALDFVTLREAEIDPKDLELALACFGLDAGGQAFDTHALTETVLRLDPVFSPDAAHQDPTSALDGPIHGTPYGDGNGIRKRYAIRQAVNTEPVHPRLDASSLGNHADLSAIRLPVNFEVRTYELVAFSDLAPDDAEALTRLRQEEQSALEQVLKARYTHPIPPQALDILRRVKYGFLPVSGHLCAVFESGAKGIECIGYDRVGGTSYGKYQISSKSGTLKRFLRFLDYRAPQWSRMLREAGPANTGGVDGSMPAVWRSLALEHPQRFEVFQDEFVLQSLYTPALQGILEETGVNVGLRSPALKEVLWSTAVQHGASGAIAIFSQSIAKCSNSKLKDYDRACIEQVYKTRQDRFVSSSKRVRQAVRSRLGHEKRLALALLEDKA